MADKMNPDMIYILTKQGKELGRGRDGSKYLVMDGKAYRICKEGVFLEGDYFVFMDATRQGTMDFVAVGADEDIPLEHRMFRLEKMDSDRNDEGVGILGIVDYENVYIKTYPIIRGEDPKDLTTGESTVADYNLSGTKGRYRIRRMF